MKVAINMRNRTLLAIATLTLTLGWASHAQAQALPTNDQANPLTDFQNPNGGTDPFNNRTGDSNSNMLQLMQRLMQQTGTSPTDFRAAQQENLTDAAAMFRAKQQARLKQQQGLQPGAPIAPVAPIVPAMPLAPLTP
jgi:flavin-binding protein dodecin